MCTEQKSASFVPKATRYLEGFSRFDARGTTEAATCDGSEATKMASTTDEDSGKEKGSTLRAQKEVAPEKEGAKNPAWANGLKQLYDSVVDEPLPDSFNDLLAKFDEDDDDGDTPKKGGA